MFPVTSIMGFCIHSSILQRQICQWAFVLICLPLKNKITHSLNQWYTHLSSVYPQEYGNRRRETLDPRRTSCAGAVGWRIQTEARGHGSQRTQIKRKKVITTKNVKQFDTSPVTRIENGPLTDVVVVVIIIFIIIIIYPFTARVVRAPHDFTASFLHFPCSQLPSGTCWTPSLSIHWCCLLTSSSVCLVFFPLSLCLAR